MCVCVCVCVCVKFEPDFTMPGFFVQGRFTIAAKHHITVAEIYESDLVDIEKVIDTDSFLTLMLLDVNKMFSFL